MIAIKQPRRGESGTVPMRTGRIFAVNSSWYFATREGTDIGPFGTKCDAESNLNTFIEFITVASEDTKQKLLSSFSSFHIH